MAVLIMVFKTVFIDQYGWSMVGAVLGKGDQGDRRHGPESFQLRREDGFIPRSTHCEVLGAPRAQGQKEPLLLCGQRQLPEPEP